MVGNSGLAFVLIELDNIVSLSRYLGESGRPGGREDLALLLGGTVRKREFEVLRQELLDVWAANGVSLLDLDDFKDLYYEVCQYFVSCLWLYLHLHGWT